MNVTCSGISFLPWLLFLPFFVKIQLAVLIFVLKKNNYSLPLSAMETYTMYSKLAQCFGNIKNNILIQMQFLFSVVRVPYRAKMASSHFCNGSSSYGSCSSVLFILFILLFLEAPWLGNKHFDCIRFFFPTAVKQIDNIFIVETYR